MLSSRSHIAISNKTRKNSIETCFFIGELEQYELYRKIMDRNTLLDEINKFKMLRMPTRSFRLTPISNNGHFLVLSSKKFGIELSQTVRMTMSLVPNDHITALLKDAHPSYALSMFPGTRNPLDMWCIETNLRPSVWSYDF